MILLGSLSWASGTWRAAPIHSFSFETGDANRPGGVTTLEAHLGLDEVHLRGVGFFS